MSFKLRTYNKISEKGLGLLPKNLYSISENEEHPDGIILRSYVMHETPLPDSLRAVGRAGAGVNNIPVDKCTDKGIVVFNAPGANSNAVAELVLSGMLISARNLYEGASFVKTLAGKPQMGEVIEKEKKAFAGFELLGKTLGVIGLGAIGGRLANISLGLGMEVVGFDPVLTPEAQKKLDPRVKVLKDITEVYKKADYLSIHVPLNNDTKGMINKDKISLMKKGSRIMNFAREGVINEEHLIEALNSKHLHSYVSDFPTDKLINMKNVVTLPHIGASTEEAEENCAIMISNQMRDFLENGNIVNAVNFPRMELPKKGSGRVSVVSKGNEGIKTQVENALKEFKVIDSKDGKKGNINYVLLNLDKKVNDNTIDTLKKLNGVLVVRSI